MAHIPAAERRPQLVQAAIELMAREGVDAGSTRAIAAELGVAQATVHYTFGTKRDLYRAVIEQMTVELVELVRGAAPEETEGPADFEQAMRRMAEALWQALREQPGRFRLFIELTTYAVRNPDLHELLRRHQRDLEETAAELIAGVLALTDGAHAAEPLVVARFFLQGFDGLSLRHLVMGDGQGDSAADADSAADLERLLEATLNLTRAK
ncbi:TetR/AcrR family transcriptional regulator [Streptomyces sp. NPDC051214]|uniref:TetR/AcrR family transcriptional regulator n=1 Tax=Streptomyces sp. NPDC051214 TaxID=3155282 RepID=UPI00343E825B